MELRNKGKWVICVIDSETFKMINFGRFLNYRTLFFLIYFFPFFSQGGLWKSSLNFGMDGGHYEVDPFHAGLRYLEQEKTEHKPENPALLYDNIGNALFVNPNESRLPTNTTNIALASLQVIVQEGGLKEFYFFHLQDSMQGPGGMKVPARFFSSAKNSLSSPAYIHLETKKDGFSSLRPSTFGGENFGKYHPFAHSEDKIFYLLNKDYKKFINAIPLGNKKIRAVILHLHTRLDMCGSCAYALDWELKNGQGFGPKIFKHCQFLNGRGHHGSLAVSALVSSRQEHLVWGASRRTLPEGPPQPVFCYYTPPQGHYNTAHAAFSSSIDLDNFSGTRQFAQSIMPAFNDPIVQNYPTFKMASQPSGAWHKLAP